MVRTTQERGTRWYRELVTNDPKCEVSDINLFELTLLMFSLWASFSSSRQKRSEGGNAPSPASTQSWVSPSYPWHPESVTAYDFLFQVPRGAKQDARVLLCVGRDIRVCTPGACTALKVRLLLSAHIQSEQMNLCVSVFYTSRQEAGNSASEVDLSIFPEIFGCNEVLYLSWVFRGH